MCPKRIGRSGESCFFKFGPLSLRVAGLGVEPSLRDYEPPVQPYTTPHVKLLLAIRFLQFRLYFITLSFIQQAHVERVI